MSLPLFFFFFNDTATTEIYTLSLHDALPICRNVDPIIAHGTGIDLAGPLVLGDLALRHAGLPLRIGSGDRKSTRLNSSHQIISYAVFCLKKKKYCTGGITSDGLSATVTAT